MENYKKPSELFSTRNAKSQKGIDIMRAYILYMSPHKQNTLGKNICPSATDGCIKSCLYTSGMAAMFKTIPLGRQRRTEYFLNDLQGFMNDAAKEIKREVSKYGINNVCFRLNGTSDIPYENIKVGEYKNIFEMFPDVQFYDYTKIFNRLTKPLPQNYHLTFSRAETQKNHFECEAALQMGFNVSAVFAVKNEKELPTMYNGYKVVSGDLHDLTFKHEKGVILGLKAKGKAKYDQTGFVIREF